MKSLLGDNNTDVLILMSGPSCLAVQAWPGCSKDHRGDYSEPAPPGAMPGPHLYRGIKHLLTSPKIQIQSFENFNFVYILQPSFLSRSPGSNDYP